MRFAFIVISALTLALPSYAWAAEPPAVPASKPAPVLTKAQRLDDLFADLKKARSEIIADATAQAINREWAQSGSASIDLLMQWANGAIDRQDYPQALDFLDQVIVLQPDFAEGWNRRATLHFLMNNFSKSMADIERTLELEPRHFGALAGMGQIFVALERKELALKSFERALEVYPMMRNVQKQVGELADELAGSGI